MARYRTRWMTRGTITHSEDRLRRENFGGSGGYEEPWGTGRRFDNERRPDTTATEFG
jgi:hypothetical protein